MITRDQTINEVTRSYPYTIEIFNRFKVDTCCGGAHSIAETMGANGLEDLTSLLHSLNRETRGLGDKSLAEVIEEIETSHHVYLKQELPALQEILDRLADEAEGGPAAAPALELRRALSAMAVEINEHLFKEERILFPTILRFETALGGEGRIDQSIFGCGTKGPIDHMHYEHKQAKVGLERIDEALRALEATGTVAEATAMLRPRLERLHDDLLEHIRAEEEDLFPRALGLEEQALAQVGPAPPDSGGRG